MCNVSILKIDSLIYSKNIFDHRCNIHVTKPRHSDYLLLLKESLPCRDNNEVDIFTNSSDHSADWYSCDYCHFTPTVSYSTSLASYIMLLPFHNPAITQASY